MRGWILVSLLLFASVFIAAASEDAQVAAAVGAAIGTDPSPTPGFIDGRIGDIQKRVEPVKRGFEPKRPAYGGPDNGFGPGPQGPGYGPDDGYDQGPRYGPDYGGGPGFGGPDYGPDDRYGPKEDYGQGFGGPQDGGYDQPYGPGPRGGTRDFRGYGAFDLEGAVEPMIFDHLGDKLEEKYGEEKLLAQCNNQPALVSLVLEEFKNSGVNLETEICSPIEEGLSFCSEAKEQCEQIGNPQFGPQFGDEEKPFIPTCPPDENQWTQMCVERMKSEFDRMSSERQEEIDSRCREEWDYRPPMEEACKDGKPRQPDMCDKSSWIAQCVQNQPPEGDYGPGPQPYGPPQGQPYGPPQGQPYGQPYQPPQNTQCPPMDENAKQQCLNNGQSYTSQTGPNGCPQIVCQGAPQPVYTGPTPTATPQSTPTLEQPPQPTATPAATAEATAQPTTVATAQPSSEPTASVTAAGYSELRLEDIPYNPGSGTYGGPQGGSGFGQPNRPAPMSPSQRCEQEWSRNEPRFTAQCQREQQRNKGPQFNFCNEQEFLSQCNAEAQKHMERDKQRMNPERVCAQQIKRDMKHFERYCKDTQRGKEQCLKESERGCEFGKKQLARCKELVQPDSIKKAIEKAVARECRARNGAAGPGRFDKWNEFVSDDLRPVLDFLGDDVSQSDQQLTEAERKERDLLYQLFRTNKDNQQQAQKFRESVEKLDASIKNLESLRESVSEDKRAQFDAEIQTIKKRRDEASSNAQALEKGSEGLLSFFAKLFGG